jgi:hypothetical protein
MGNNVSAIISVTAGGRNRPMRNNVSAVITVAAGRGNWTMREQLQAASISYGAYHKRQNNYCANCTTQYERTTKFCH